MIARIAGRLVANPDGRWTFAEVPDHLRGEPVLAVSVESAEAAPREAELRYLAGGLNWRATYTADGTAPPKP